MCAEEAAEVERATGAMALPLSSRPRAEAALGLGPREEVREGLGVAAAAEALEEEGEGLGPRELPLPPLARADDKAARAAAEEEGGCAGR